MNQLNLSPRTTGKSISIIHKLREEQAKEDKRRDIVNKIKESLVEKFQAKVALLHHKKTFETGYTDEIFCKEMTELIDYFQGRLDKLKVDGKFYTTIKCDEVEKIELSLIEDATEPCAMCENMISLEDGENEECENYNEMGCYECITHTEEDRYLCSKCI